MNWVIGVQNEINSHIVTFKHIILIFLNQSLKRIMMIEMLFMLCKYFNYKLKNYLLKLPFVVDLICMLLPYSRIKRHFYRCKYTTLEPYAIIINLIIGR